MTLLQSDPVSTGSILAVAAVAVAGVIFNAGFVYSKLQWLTKNCATKADLDQKTNMLDCERLHGNCLNDRKLVEQSLQIRVSALEKSAVVVGD